jgi:hypothetical protein
MPLRYAANIIVLGLIFASAHSQNSNTNWETNPSGKTWHFAVSGDSRNCGDVVMPAIAKRVREDGASFYWHLGDFRAIYDFDQDFKQTHSKVSISDYEASAWLDFIEQQLAPFGDLPIYISLRESQNNFAKNTSGCASAICRLVRHSGAQEPALKGRSTCAYA